MSTKVASILAEIGIDTSKFTAGINSFGGSINTAIGKLGGLGKGLNDVTQSLTGFNLAQLGIAGGVSMLIKEIASATEETQAYNLAMYDLAQKMGTSTEEASKLVQVGDDLRISQEQISTAMTYAIRNGVEPNIEGLADLADQYVALQDPGERGRLLLEKFGRSGMDMGRLMEQGGAGIREMSGAIEDNLIVTEKAAKASRDWYEAQDKLNDQWTGIKMQVGNEVIPSLTKLANIQEEYSKLRKEDSDSTNMQTIPILGLWANAVMGVEAVYRTLIPVVEEVTNANLVADVTGADMAETLRGLGIAASNSVPQVEGLKSSINGLEDKDIYITTYTRSVNLDNGWMSESAQESMRYRSANATMTQGQYNQLYGRGYANGADFIVPPGFQNDSYPMRVQSGERVQVTPAGQAAPDMSELARKLDALPRAIAKAYREAAIMGAQ